MFAWDKVPADERAVFATEVGLAIRKAWVTQELKPDSEARNTEDVAVRRGSGDFLKDMGYADPDAMRTKFGLANRIALMVEGLTLERAAAATGMSTGRIRALADGRVLDIPVEELRRVLATLVAGPSMKRWDRKTRNFIEAPDVDAFLAEIVALCERYKMSIGHEDRHGAFEIYRTFEPEAIRWMMHAHVEVFDNELEIWLSALTVDAQPSAADLAAAPVVQAWRWAPTDTSGLYVRGLVDGRDYTTGELVGIDAGRRWVRDRDGKLWRLGQQQ